MASVTSRPTTFSQTNNFSADWSNLSNVGASDDAYATVVDPIPSSRLNLTGYNFSAIPSDATLTGVEFSLERKVNTAGIRITKDDAGLSDGWKLLKAGTPSGNFKGDTTTQWPTTDTVATYGGDGDLWGNTLSVADVKDADFGVGVTCKRLDANPGSVTASIDDAPLTVYFTLATPTLTDCSPASGSTDGGDSVTLTGTGFFTGATVTFGGDSATNVVVVSETEITCDTPAHAAGTVDVVVTNVDAIGATLTDGYEYVDTGPSGPVLSHHYRQMAAAG